MAFLRSALTFAALLTAIAGPVAAGTLGVAWDPSSDPAVTGYRVYVGTSPGQPSEFFDVARFQTSFYYTAAVEGRRYYFAIASKAGSVTGALSGEVSAVAGGFVGTPVPEPTPGAPASPGGPGADYWSRYAAGRRALDPDLSFESASVVRLATGLRDVTAIAALPTGGGLLVEAGTRVRLFTERGVASDTALEAAEGTRLVSAVADPQFASTGFVFVAQARSTPEGGEEVDIVRHRFLAGVLGESATVLPALRQPAGALTPLAITSTGQLLVAQAGQVLRFEGNGAVPRDQVMGSPVWAAGVGDSRALAWDDAGAGVWSVALDAASEATLAFGSRAPVLSGARQIPGPAETGGLVDADVAVYAGATHVAVATATTVRRFDVATSRLSSGVVLAEYGTVVSVVSASPNVDYVVVREPGASETAPFALLRIDHDALQ